MVAAAISRRDLLRSLSWLAAGCAARRMPAGDHDSVAVELVANGAGGRREDVQFGVPLPPGFLDAVERVRVVDALGHELEAHTAALEHWRIGEPAAAVRSVLIQLRGDFTRAQQETIRVRFDGRGRARAPLFGTEDALIARGDAVEPRVLALLPPTWMCASWLAGPQVAASEAGPYATYDHLVERSFPGSLAFASFHYWLLFSDARVPTMIVRVCDLFDRKAFRPDGRPYYIVDCLGAESVVEAPGIDPADPGMERHSLELAYLFAMGCTSSAIRHSVRGFAGDSTSCTRRRSRST